MNPTTLKEFNAICEKAKQDIIAAQQTGDPAEAIHFSVVVELLTLVLMRIDQVEAQLITEEK